MKKLLVVLAVLAVLFVGCVATTSDETITASPEVSAPAAEPETTTEPAPTTKPEPTTVEPETTTSAPAEDGQLSDDGWRVESLRVGEDFIGDFEADARIVNETGQAVEGAFFDLTILDGGTIVATLMGSASAVGVGETATVEFISTDDFVEGDFTYDFQVGGSF